MGKTISSAVLSETLCISECTDGFWLYDKTRGMNLAMRAKTKDDAFVRALIYYQDRLQRIEAEHTILKTKVDIFVSQFIEEDE